MSKLIDLTNQKFNKLLVIKYLGRKNNHSAYECKCDCGNIIIAISNNLKRNHTKSCGCYNIEKIKERSTTHNLRMHPLYISWCGMKNRCYNKKHNRYKNYGGKGIIVCDEWISDFYSFYKWGIGKGWENGKSIDRIDNSKNYSPDNCKFSTPKEQCRNRTCNVKLTINGETKILIEWAEFYNINYGTFLSRFKKGWAVNELIYGKSKK
jgi:hypothetical protein